MINLDYRSKNLDYQLIIQDFRFSVHWASINLDFQLIIQVYQISVHWASIIQVYRGCTSRMNMSLYRKSHAKEERATTNFEMASSTSGNVNVALVSFVFVFVSIRFHVSYNGRKSTSASTVYNVCQAWCVSP